MIQQVIRGRDSVNRVPEMMKALGMEHPLLIGSRHLLPRLQKADALKDAPVFTGYHPNPDLGDAEEAVRMYRDHGCDGLISIGGGSAMDTAKAVKAWLCSGGPEDLRKNQVNIPETEKPARINSPADLKKRAERQAAKYLIPHIAIPGTAGSGAETTANAVLYENDQKMSLGHPALLPEGAVLDASLLETLPEYHKKSCALDALCQGIESFWAKAATEDSRVHAFLAFQGVLDNIKAYLAGDPHAAEVILDASYQSGRAIFFTRTTAAHAMSYQITKLLGPAHGHACALTLPILWDMLTVNEETQETMKELAARMRLGNPQMGSRLIRGLMIDLDMPLPDMPDEETLDKLTDSVNLERLGNHPMQLTRQQIHWIYKKAFTPLPENERQACLDIWKYYGA